MAAVQQIFAFSGMLESDGDQRTNSALTRFAWSLTGKPNGQRVCYVPTALGDSSAAIEAKTREFNSEHPSAHLSTFTVFPQPTWLMSAGT